MTSFPACHDNRSNRLSPGVIFWFRNDLRLHDQVALAHAIDIAHRLGGWLLPVYIHDNRLDAMTPWGFKRIGAKQTAWVRMALDDLFNQLTRLGSTLIQVSGNSAHVLVSLVHVLGGPLIVCEEIAAPEEQDQVEEIRRNGVSVETVWQSTLIAPESLPFKPEELPDTFTKFRQLLEQYAVRATPPLEDVKVLPPLPGHSDLALCRGALHDFAASIDSNHPEIDPRSSFPWNQLRFHGSESAALAHIDQYCRRSLPHSYKSTRNELIGIDYSSKWSPWLATGALSARRAWAVIAKFEEMHGANESTYWLFFELLWRDHFRWLHLKYGKLLYAARGLKNIPLPKHDHAAFKKWCEGETGNAFIDAGMNELALTGYLSNRIRQNVASFLIHDLRCDWRAGAAWFEANLIDYDVYSNQGNWLYLSGRGTDPRPTRRFNPQLQAKNYDPEGIYRKMWLET